MLLRDHLTVELEACRQPWVDGLCAGGAEHVLGPTALAEAEGERVQLEVPGPGGSTGTHVLLTVALAGDLPQEAEGTRTRIVLGVHGTGDDQGRAGNHEGRTGDDQGGNGSSPGLLPDTGARLGGFALLGVLAVAVGFALARMRGVQA
ncbi:hypothetical protein AAHB33_02190 [Paenarthrobacter sp. S56]|uniref:hypothetical protein n=1 Tax=Paenarthrobacter sp. S56 TaxID=3138179 RepID=UPI00321BB499